MQVSELGQPALTVACDGLDGYGAEVRYFVDCVANRRRPAIVIACDEVTALEICEAEEKSIRTGAVVKV